MWAKQKTNGFTIVELLIVIVVIGILAAITIVAYNGIQARANDTRIRSVANQITKAVILWNTDSGVSPKGGWSSTVAFDGTNCVDGAGGWVFKGAYVCSLEDILQGKGLTPPGLVVGAPKNKAYGALNDGRYSFMFYPCSGTNRFALYWYLENPSTEDTTNLAAAETSGCPSAPRATYGMRAATIVQL
jgi:prepilin-type N-terminal cleavage/methylation domain-containing protein